MKKKHISPIALCCYCKKPYERAKGKGLGCASCWEARWQRYAAEDAVFFYISPLAGIND